jgi:hypothetical protein
MRGAQSGQKYTTGSGQSDEIEMFETRRRVAFGIGICSMMAVVRGKGTARMRYVIAAARDRRRPLLGPEISCTTCDKHHSPIFTDKSNHVSTPIAGAKDH